MRAPKTSSILAAFLLTAAISSGKTNYAYIANYQSNSVSVINTANNSVFTTIPVGANPWGVAVNQAGSLALVTNAGDNSLSFISTGTNTVTATIPVGTAPAAVAFAPNGKTAYIANSGSNSVSVVSVSKKLVTATVTVQNYPYGVAVTPNGAFVYVSNFHSNSVSVISTLTNKVVATIAVGAGPTFLAMSPDGTAVCVPNNGANTISVIRTADNSVVSTITVEGAWGAAISPDGRWLYSTDYTAGSGDLVTVINIADITNPLVSGTIVVGLNPLQTAFSQDSAFAYVANSGAESVTVIVTGSKTVLTTVNVGTHPVGATVMGTVKISTVAGGYVGDNGPATSAAINGAFSTVQDQTGNYYVSDELKHRIRKITPAGTITTYAGTGICGYNGENIPAKKAMLCYPAGLAFDSAGNLYVADSGSQRVRKISPKGTITTIAGSGVNGYTGNGGPAISAALSGPRQIAFDSAGNIYISELTNNVIRKVDSSGTISLFAGSGVAGFGGDGGPATSATLYWPRGIAFDSSGNFYIADSNNRRVRIVSTNGTINTFAGNGNGGCQGDGGLAVNARIGNPHGLNIHNSILYFGGGCSRLRAIDLNTNIITTFAGSIPGYDGDNNPPLASRFIIPNDTVFDPSGNVLIADQLNGRIRKLSNGLINTFAGGFLGDGNSGPAASFVLGEALAIDKSNNLYVADYYGNRIRKVSSGKISTLAGNGINGYSGDGGPANSPNTELYFPQGVAADSAGNVFVSDSGNFVIRKIDASGNISTFASDPNFCDLAQMTTDSANNLYIADDCTSVIFKITPTGTVSVIAGVPFEYGYNGDNIPATRADLNSAFSVAVDKSGNLFIADTYNSRIRMVDTSGIIHTIAGNGFCAYGGDGGSASLASLCYPWSIAVSGSSDVYFSDIFFLRVRRISGGIISAFAGTVHWPGNNGGFNGDGLWPLSTILDDPIGVAVDSKGAVYVLDDAEERVRKIK
jgi:YVTN family beta-propeller protein